MSERRQVPRYHFGGQGQLIRSTAGADTALKIASISVQGCRTEGGKVPSPGLKCTLKFEWEGKTFEAESEVAWANRDGKAGLRFISVSEESLNVLRELCENLPLEPLSPKAPR